MYVAATVSENFQEFLDCGIDVMWHCPFITPIVHGDNCPYCGKVSKLVRQTLRETKLQKYSLPVFAADQFFHLILENSDSSFSNLQVDLSKY